MDNHKKAPVSADASKKPYYKYYEWDILAPTTEQMDMIARSKGSAESGLSIHDCNRVLTELLPKNMGYYPLAEGGMLVSNDIYLPNVNSDMLEWWFAWHGLDPLRYTIWDPEDHYGLQLNEEGRARALDQNVPMCEKTWGATHIVQESIGGPPDEITIMFQNPSDMGFDMNLVGTPKCRFIVIANALMGSQKIPVVMLETASDHPEGGVVYHCRFWIGYHIVDGKGVCLVPPGLELPEQVAQGLLAHNFKEFGHLNKVLPLVYAEEKDNF